MAVPVRGHPAVEATCEHCGQEFIHYQRRQQRFCSLRCGSLAHYARNPVRRLDPTEVFEQRVLPRLAEGPSGCLLWTGAKNNRGYGQTTVDRKRRYVHRLAWEYHFGPIPDGLLVLHRCDVPLCARSDHLFLGTQKDNMQDCAAKGRMGHQRRLNAIAA